VKWFGGGSGEQFHFEVDGVRCTQCEATIKIALRSLPVVQNVKIQKKKHVQIELASY
jgi:copper chaperone CopZ